VPFGVAGASAWWRDAGSQVSWAGHGLWREGKRTWVTGGRRRAPGSGRLPAPAACCAIGTTPETAARWPWLGPAYGAIWAPAAVRSIRSGWSGLRADACEPGRRGLIARPASSARATGFPPSSAAGAAPPGRFDRGGVVSAVDERGRSPLPIRGGSGALPMPGGASRRRMQGRLSRGAWRRSGRRVHDDSRLRNEVTSAGLRGSSRSQPDLSRARAATVRRTWAGLRPVSPDGRRSSAPARSARTLVRDWAVKRHLLSAITAALSADCWEPTAGRTSPPSIRLVLALVGRYPCRPDLQPSAYPPPAPPSPAVLGSRRTAGAAMSRARRVQGRDEWTIRLAVACGGSIPGSRWGAG
jgi:hypothetical protein